MYFAIEASNTSLPVHICHALAKLGHAHPEAPVHLFALVDGAFDEGIITERQRIAQRLPRQSLYANTRLESLGAAAPHLLTTPAAAAEQLSWLQALFARCAGKPMLSVIATKLDAAALQAHLRPYVIAKTPDSMEWPVRWADTRVLPALMHTIDAAHRTHLLSPMHFWWAPGRDGALLSWQGAGVLAPSPAGFELLPLSDEAFVSLVDAAEADAVLANLEDHQPDLLRPLSPAQCHALVEKHLAIASRHGVEAARARQHFSALSLALADGFTQHPAMAALLHSTSRGGDYFAQVGALSPGFWQDAARPDAPSSHSAQKPL